MSSSYTPTVVMVPDRSGTFMMFPAVTNDGQFCDEPAAEAEMSIAAAIVDKTQKISADWDLDEPKRLQQVVDEACAMISANKEWSGASFRFFPDYVCWTDTKQHDLETRAKAITAQESTDWIQESLAPSSYEEACGYETSSTSSCATTEDRDRLTGVELAEDEESNADSIADWRFPN